GRNRVEGPLGGGEAPEAATRGLRAGELRNSGRRSRSKRDGHRAPLEAEGRGELPFDRAVVDGTVGHDVLSQRSSGGYTGLYSGALTQAREATRSEASENWRGPSGPPPR